MDTLYSEMSQVIEAQVLPMALKPLTGASWRDRLLEITQRRALVFEAILPFRISANIKRFQSEFLMQDYRRMLRLEFETLEAHLPSTVKVDLAGTRGLHVVLSFQTWRLLRHDQELPVEEAKAVVRRLLGYALAAMPDN